MRRKAMTGNTMRILGACLVLLSIAGILSAGCGSEERTLTINDVKLSEKDLPGWRLDEEIKATVQNAAKGSVVKELYDAGAVTILNQVFTKDGRRLQVNYVQMETTKDAEHAEAMLEAAVNGTNYIGNKDNLAIEIIGTMPDTTAAAKELGLVL